LFDSGRSFHPNSFDTRAGYYFIAAIPHFLFQFGKRGVVHRVGDYDD